MAMMAIFRGWAALMSGLARRARIGSFESEGQARPCPRLAPLQPADHRLAQAREPAVPTARIADDARLVERRAQHRRMRHLAADAAADAGVEHRRYRVAAQRIGVGLDRKRRAAREANARMVARAGVSIDAEALAHDALAGRDRLLHERLLAALLV